MNIRNFKSFVIEKLLLSIVHRHAIQNVTVNDKGFEITTDGHRIIGIDTADNNGDFRMITIYIERKGEREPLLELHYSEDQKYDIMKKTKLSTFDADIMSPLSSIFDDWDHDRIAVISFGYKDPVKNLFRYRIVIDQKNTVVIARSKSGFQYAFLDTDMKAFLNNRDKGIASNIILRRIEHLSGHAMTAEMPFEPVFELFEDACTKPPTPMLKNGEIITEKPLYWYKSPTVENTWVVILSIERKKGEGFVCRSGYADTEPKPLSTSWVIYNVRKTQVFYITAHRRYQIFRGDNCVDITHLVRKHKQTPGD